MMTLNFERCEKRKLWKAIGAETVIRAGALFGGRRCLDDYEIMQLDKVVKKVVKCYSKR